MHFELIKDLDFQTDFIMEVSIKVNDHLEYFLRKTTNFLRLINSFRPHRRA